MSELFNALQTKLFAEGLTPQQLEIFNNILKIEAETKRMEIEAETKRKKMEIEAETERIRINNEAEIEKLRIQYSQIDLSHIGSITDAQFWKKVDPGNLAPPPKSDFAVLLPHFWDELTKFKNEVPAQNFFHTKADGLIEGRVFLNGNSSKLLGSEVVPDEYVFEKGFDSLPNALALVEWKAPGEKLDDSAKGQAADEGRFFKVERDGLGYSYEMSAELDATEGYEYFYSLLSQEPSILGSDFLPKINGVQVGMVVGKGATSVVYRGMNEHRTTLAVKVINKDLQELVNQEIEILKKCGSYNAGIPTLSGLMQEANFPARVILLSPFLTPLKTIDWAQVGQLVKALEHVHQVGYLHRDIRRDNVMANGSKVYLVDFGFAVQKGANVAFQGALSTASNRILDILSDPNKGLGHAFQHTVEDEVQSLVKTVYLFRNPIQAKSLPKKGGDTAKELLQYWNNRPWYWQSALKTDTLANAETDLMQHFP